MFDLAHSNGLLFSCESLLSSWNDSFFHLQIINNIFTLQETLHEWEFVPIFWWRMYIPFQCRGQSPMGIAEATQDLNNPKGVPTNVIPFRQWIFHKQRIKCVRHTLIERGGGAAIVVGIAGCSYSCRKVATAAIVRVLRRVAHAASITIPALLAKRRYPTSTTNICLYCCLRIVCRHWNTCGRCSPWLWRIGSGNKIGACEILRVIYAYTSGSRVKLKWHWRNKG